MKPCTFLFLFAFALSGSNLYAQDTKPSAPNIVFIMVDDMGRDWVSCYGSEHPTPNIDRLASEGIRYETAWCMPICTPTRATLLTGQYPFRHGWIDHYDVPRWGGDGLRPDKTTTFAKVLRDAGYATAIGGKWQINHLGKQPDILKQHGFDEHCVWTGVEAGNAASESRYFDGYIQTNGKRTVEPYGPDAINRFLIDFMQRHRDGPFLVYYPMLLTHGPHGATPLNRDDPPQDKASQFAGEVTYMDKLVGNLVGAIDKLGIGHNTVIFFTGDNGSSVAGTLGDAAYKKGKGGRADWGVHVPLVVRGPSVIKRVKVSNDLVDFTDFFPTFLDLAGISAPKGLTLDGVSMLPSLQDDDDAFKKRNWIYSQIGDFRMVRDWEYLVDNQEGCYNLQRDPLQEKNLYTSKERIVPGRRERLKIILDRFPADATAPYDSDRVPK